MAVQRLSAPTRALRSGRVILLTRARRNRKPEFRQQFRSSASFVCRAHRGRAMNGQAARTSARASSDARPQSHRPRVHMAAFAAGKSCPATGITRSRRAQTFDGLWQSGIRRRVANFAKRLDWQISRSRRTVSNSVMLTAVNVCYCEVGHGRHETLSDDSADFVQCVNRIAPVAFPFWFSTTHTRLTHSGRLTRAHSRHRCLDDQRLGLRH